MTGPALSADDRCAIFEDLGIRAYVPVLDLQTTAREEMIQDPALGDRVLFVQHPAVYTLGKRGGRENLVVPERFLAEKGIGIVQTARGGNITFHGPGQAVLYPIINLERSRIGVADFVHGLEKIMMRTARQFGVKTRIDPKNQGLWVGKKKIGSVGISIKKGISIHGLALNVCPDMAPFTWINPCGFQNLSMTSLEQENRNSPFDPKVSMEQVKNLFFKFFCEIFNFNTREKSMKTLCKGHTETRSSGSGAIRKGKPKWLKKSMPKGGDYQKVTRLLSEAGLHTVCQEAACPNMFECFSKNTATFMILGSNCTRNCRFCNVTSNSPTPVDPDEPQRVADTVLKLKLTYVVVTSVTRDDLPDGGASHFARVIQAIKKAGSGIRVEVLIPDFQGDVKALKTVAKADPDVINHNIETVKGLYARVRPQAQYQRSLDLMRNVTELFPGLPAKSGIMVGLGETIDELGTTFQDLYDHGCNILTVGQYLQPTRDHFSVEKFYSPEEFEQLHRLARDIGFKQVAAGPFVRSSYKARELFETPKTTGTL